MGSLNLSDERKHSTPKPILYIVARGRSRFLVIYSLTGTIILWIAVSGALMIRGSLHGLGVANVVFLETVSLLTVFPFALAIACHQWKKFQKMASTDGSSVADQDTTRCQNHGETK
jgi:hypothetical protein